MKSVSATNQLASIRDHIEEISSQDRSQFLSTGLWAAVLANLLWGTSFLASKYTIIAWGPFTASALRFVIATIFIFIGLKIFGRRLEVPGSRKDWLYVFAIATTGFGALYPLQLAGLKFISSGLSAAIMLTSPLVVIFAAQVFLRDALTIRKLLAILIGIAGGVILLSANNRMIPNLSSAAGFGAILTLGASLCLALSVIATRKLAGRLDSASLTFWSMGIGFVELGVAAFLFEEEGLANIFRNASWDSWVALFFLALVCSAFCFFIWNFALSKSSPKDIASTMHIKTPTAVIIGVLAASELVTKSLVIGTMIVMFGVWLSQTGGKKERA